MGSQATLSGFSAPKEADYGVGNLYGGGELWKSLQGKMNSGLSSEARGIMEKQGLGGISGQTSAGLDKIKTGFNNAGLSSAAKLGAMSNLYQGQQDATSGLFQNIGLAEEQARQRNYGTGLEGMLGMYSAADRLSGLKNQFALNSSGMQNEYNMNKYQVDKQNEFSWGGLLGGLLGVGGQLGGAYLGNPNLFTGKSTGGG